MEHRRFEDRLREQAQMGLDVTEKVLAGKVEETSPIQVKTALSLLSTHTKQQAVQNGRLTQIISLTKLGVRDPQSRERIALAALGDLLPAGTVGPASGEVTAEQRPALDAPKRA